MHINVENHLVEFRPVPGGAGEVCEILLTDLNNWGMPFSRYAVGDLGVAVADNRHGLVVGARATPATGTAARETAVDLVAGVKRRQRTTLGADKAYDTAAFVAAVRALGITPHVAQHTSGRASAIDRRTTRHPGYLVSQRFRKRIEEVFGWLKTVGLLRKTRHRGKAKVNWVFVFATAIYNLIRIRNLSEAPA